MRQLDKRTKSPDARYGCTRPVPAARPSGSCGKIPGMKPNRSIPAATVIPVLIYPDVRAAVAFLTTAFGFEERVKIGEDHRSQLRYGDGGLIVADVRHDRQPPT